MTNPIAVSGATGALGGRVAALLASRGLPVRLLTRDAGRAPSIPGTAVVGGASYGDGDRMREALDGADTFLMVSATEAEDRAGKHKSAVDAAVAAGVRRLVYTSFAAAGPACTFTFGRDHWVTEAHIRSTGLAYTFVRDNLYLDALPYFPGPDGVIRGPAGRGRFGGVARHDVADALVGVLTSTGHDGATYDLTGPEAISMDDVATALTRASGRLITYDAETLDQAYASRAHYHAPDWQVAGWVTSYAAIAAGELNLVSDAVDQLAGHRPMSFAEYLQRNPAVADRLR